MAFPRPGTTGSRAAGLSVPACTALAVLCCSGLLPALSTATMSLVCTPKALSGLRSWCQSHRGEGGCPTAESSATGVVPSLSEDPDSHFSSARGSFGSTDLLGWRVTHMRQGPSGSTAGVAPFHTWPPPCPQCKVGLKVTADMTLLCLDHTASLCGNSCFPPCCWSHWALTWV